MPITHFRLIFNFLDELATVLETLIYYLQRFNLLFKEEKCEMYGHTPILQSLSTVPVPVTEPGTGTKFANISISAFGSLY